MNIIEICKSDRFDQSHVVPVMTTMRIVISDNSAIVALEYAMVNIRQIVPRDAATRINPDFTPQAAIAAFFSDEMRFIDNLFISHPPSYPGAAIASLT